MKKSAELLQFIYKLSRGNPNEIISRKNLGKPLGLSNEETRDILAYLTEERLIRYILFDALCITHIGIAEAEKAITPPRIETPQPEERIVVLFLAADPTDAARLRLGEEVREIGEKLQLSRLRDRFRLEIRLSVRPEDLTQVMLDLKPRIVHFSGHGTETGMICLENELGQVHPVAPEALAALFEVFANQVECVILNACNSEPQAKATGEHIHYAIGMSKEIGDRAAIAFSTGFYQALGAGLTIQEAYNLGCVQIRLQGIPEHLTPMLVTK